MGLKEAIARFVIGTIVFFVLYAVGLYLIEGEVDWLQSLFVAPLWSLGMVLFEYFWQKRSRKA